MTRRVWSMLAVLVSLALVIGACQAQPGGGPAATTAAGAADPNGELVTNTGTEPDTIDPHKASYVGEIEQILSVFEGLMTLDPKTLKPIPAQAAKDPDVSADGKTWTFVLRDGLKFSNGQPVTAADFARGFTRTCDPKTAGEYQFVLAIIVGCDDWFNMDLKKSTPEQLAAAKAKLGIKAIDAKTLQFTLTEPAPYFKSIAYMWVGMPVLQESLDKGGDNWTQPATYIGNGPFILKEHQPNNKFVYEANPNYWRGAPKIKKWTRVMIQESAVAFAAYKAGDLDAHGLTAADYKAAIADPKLKAEVKDLTYAGTRYLMFNAKKPPFDDANVRLAFAKAIDKDEFCKNVVIICSSATGGFIPPGLPGHDEADTAQKFDPAAAKATLDKASAAAKAALSDVKLSFASLAVERTRVEFLQSQLEKNLSIKVALDPIDASAYSKAQKEGRFQMATGGWIADFPDQQNWHSTVWGPTAVVAKRSGWTNTKFTELTGQADKEGDPKKRDDLYLQAGKILSQDAPAAWTFYYGAKSVRKPWLKGVTDSSIDSILGQFKVWEVYVTKKS